MAVYDKKKGFDRSIHNIERSYFRPKFEDDMLKKWWLAMLPNVPL